MYYKFDCWLKRRRFKAGEFASPLATLYQHPIPSLADKIKDTRFLVIDCEMTGMQSSTDSLLSIGWVEVQKMQVQLGTAQHFLIDSGAPVGESATIHGILDRHMGEAQPLEKVLRTLCTLGLGKVAVFHHASLDIAFIQKAAQDALGGPLYLPYADTMQVEKRRQTLKNQSAPLQLAACRQRYNLPSAQEHNALSDARATAELLLAQCAHMGAPDKLVLGDLGVRCM